MKNRLKFFIIELFKRVLVKDEVKRVLVDSLRGIFPDRFQRFGTLAHFTEQPPYAEIGNVVSSVTPSEELAPIFISGRFRSGSTLLWNIFRSIPGVTSYYEPFNENRWFDPLGPKKDVDNTHKMVDNYSKEYHGLEGLIEFYREDWIRHNLYMDEAFYDSNMEKFISHLLGYTPERTVLQFNRIDFRLPWIRHNFPHARILHIYRHPRDQWCSSLIHMDSCSPQGTMAQFAECPGDRFYVRLWGKDLKYQFPFLDEQLIRHPYELFYYLWKLSFIAGKQYAHHSICFEQLINGPKKILTPLFEALHLEIANWGEIEQLIVKPQLNKWQQYADNEWFSRIETHCEKVLQDFLNPSRR